MFECLPNEFFPKRNLYLWMLSRRTGLSHFEIFDWIDFNIFPSDHDYPLRLSQSLKNLHHVRIIHIGRTWSCRRKVKMIFSLANCGGGSDDIHDEDQNFFYKIKLHNWMHSRIHSDWKSFHWKTTSFNSMAQICLQRIWGKTLSNRAACFPKKKTNANLGFAKQQTEWMKSYFCKSNLVNLWFSRSLYALAIPKWYERNRNMTSFIIFAEGKRTGNLKTKVKQLARRAKEKRKRKTIENVFL